MVIILLFSPVDAESTSEKAMCESGIDLSCDVLVPGHHGSATATSWDFLQATVPEYAVISCGKDNQYGHPDKDVMDKLENMGDFDYDPDADAAYQQYKNQYTRGAELASENAAANASARSGGYGNSWGTSSGQTAYQSTMNGLSDVADSLYSQAYNEYATKKSDLSSRLSSLQQQEKLAQDAYNTRLNNYYGQLNSAQTEYANAVRANQKKDANNTNSGGTFC